MSSRSESSWDDRPCAVNRVTSVSQVLERQHERGHAVQELLRLAEGLDRLGLLERYPARTIVGSALAALEASQGEGMILGVCVVCKRAERGRLVQDEVGSGYY